MTLSRTLLVAAAAGGCNPLWAVGSSSYNMSTPRSTSRLRWWFTLISTALATIFVVALIAFGAMNRPSGEPTLRSFSLLLLPVAVFLVCRFARTSVTFYVLQVGLVVYSVYVAFNALTNGHDDAWLWIQVSAITLSGLGLLCRVRWAPYLWYATVSAWFVLVVQMAQESAQGPWHWTAAVWPLGAAFLWLTVGFGGAAVVAVHARSSDALPKVVGQATSRRTRFDFLFGMLCLASSVWLAWNWFDSRIPDTAGIEQLHASLRSRAAGGADAPQCDKVNFCGAFVELSCHPEGDGLVSYHNNATGTLVMNCGGSCMGGMGPAGTTRCSACPPPEWQECSTK